MLVDLVVDTNVFQHSYDPRQQLRSAAARFFLKLESGQTLLCVDEGFDFDPARNRSLIGHEYVENITHGSPAFAAIVKLGISGRIRKLPRQVNPATNKVICQQVSNKPDRVFLKITFNSQSCTLVSHDFRDFSLRKRELFRKSIGIHIVTAKAANESL